MRKFARIFAGVLVAALMVTATYQAFTFPRYVDKPVGHQVTSQGGPAGAGSIYRRDTTIRVIGTGASSCTTGTFTLDNLVPGPQNFIDAATDSAILGWLMIESDTTAGTIGVTTVVCSLQVRPGVNTGSNGFPVETQFTTVRTMTVSSASGGGNQRAWSIPIPAALQITAGAGGNSALMVGLPIRCLINAAGTTIPAARIKVVYAKETGN